jgi:hypothetical protein
MAFQLIIFFKNLRMQKIIYLILNPFEYYNSLGNDVMQHAPNKPSFFLKEGGLDFLTLCSQYVHIPTNSQCVSTMFPMHFQCVPPGSQFIPKMFQISFSIPYVNYCPKSNFDNLPM